MVLQLGWDDKTTFYSHNMSQVTSDHRHHLLVSAEPHPPNQKKDVMKYTPHLKLINQRVWKFPEVISMINDTTKKLLETMKRKSKKWSLVWWWIILGQSSNILIYVDLRPTAKLIHLNWKNSKLQYFVKNSRKNLIYHFPDERIIEHPQAARWKKQSLTEKYLMDKEIELGFVKALPRHPSASVNI